MHDFDTWLHALDERHLADLTFPEVSRALRALSSAYVERRGRLKAGAALSGAGKRAAFALFYGPLHYLLVREIAAAIGFRPARLATLIDLGCGTGAAGAAWARTFPRLPAVVGSRFELVGALGGVANLPGVRPGGAHTPRRHRHDSVADVAGGAARRIHVERARGRGA